MVARRVFALAAAPGRWCGAAAAPAPTWRRSASGCSSCRPSTRRSGSRSPPSSSRCSTATPADGERLAAMAAAWAELRCGAGRRSTEAREDADARPRAVGGSSSISWSGWTPLRSEPGERERDRRRARAAAPPRRAGRGRHRRARPARPRRRRGRAGAGRAGRRSCVAEGERVRAARWPPSPPSCATPRCGCRRRRPTLRGYTADLEADPGRLEAIERRLELFAELERRFGAPLERRAGAGRRGPRGARAAGAVGRGDGAARGRPSGAAEERRRGAAASCTPPASAAPRRSPARWSRSWPTSAWTARGSWSS